MSLPLDTREWLTVEAAAKLAGQAVRSWRRRAKEEFERARREGRDARAVKAAPFGYAGKRYWWVRRSLDPRLSPCAGAAPPRPRTRGSLLARYPQHHVDRAYRKSRWLLAWRKLCDECHDRKMTEKKLADRIVRQARAVEGAGFRISFRSLQFWRKAHNRLGTDGEMVGVDVSTLEEARTTVGAWIGEYHHTVHSVGYLSNAAASFRATRVGLGSPP